MKLFGLLPLHIFLAASSCLVHRAASTPAGVPAGYKPSKGVRPQEPKYFQEPGDTAVLGHYDARFFKALVPYEEHGPALRHLIRSYLLVFRALGAETWLAHGTLLGWYWNGQIMPWDSDLDVQVSYAKLDYLGEHHNYTTHEYRYVESGAGVGEGVERTKRYLLDINPYHKRRERLQGMNVIDARWIDTDNGMFIDITALAERDSQHRPGIWSCKNFHRYRTRDLFPMRQSEFEGVPATIPYNFDQVLWEEYGQKSMMMTVWQGHRWEPRLKEWVKMS